jgi:CMP/dCMP kinase
MQGLLITIDGPAGAGKTTVSRALADRLAYRYIDTGALYRAVALSARRLGLAPDDDAGLEAMCRDLPLAFVREKEGVRLRCRDEDITAHIRAPEVTMMASAVSARPVVRRFLLDVQRRMGAEKGVVFEGRDMGTVVFPSADVKFFLDADADIRARRRYLEQGDDAGQSLAAVEKDMQRRDRADSTRTLAPLKPADDAIVIDSTQMDIDAVVETMLGCIHR